MEKNSNETARNTTISIKNGDSTKWIHIAHKKKWVNIEHTQTHSYYIESATSASKWKRAAKTEKRKTKKKLRKKITRELTRTLSTVSFSMFGAIKKSNQKNRERNENVRRSILCSSFEHKRICTYEDDLWSLDPYIFIWKNEFENAYVQQQHG